MPDFRGVEVCCFYQIGGEIPPNRPILVKDTRRFHNTACPVFFEDTFALQKCFSGFFGDICCVPLMGRLQIGCQNPLVVGMLHIGMVLQGLPLNVGQFPAECVEDGLWGASVPLLAAIAGEYICVGFSFDE